MNAQMTKQEFGSWGMRVTGLAIAYLVFVLVLPFFVAQSILWFTLIMFIAAGCFIALLLWGQNDLIYLIRVQVEYTIFCAAAMGSLALVFFFVPMWTWQEALVFKAIVSGSVIAAVAALSRWRSFNKKYPPVAPRDLVQFALKATAIVASIGYLVLYAILWVFANDMNIIHGPWGLLALFGLAALYSAYKMRGGYRLRKTMKILSIIAFLGNILLAALGFRQNREVAIAWALTVIVSFVMMLTTSFAVEPEETE